MDTKTRKVLFVVPDGVGIKNYLYSKILTYLKADDIQIVIWSPLPKVVFEAVERLHHITIEYKYIELEVESPLTRLYREATTYARLKHNAKLKNNTSILTNWPTVKGFSKRAWLQRVSKGLGNYLAKDYKRILNFETKSKKYWSKSIINQFKFDLEALQPQSVFITHQRVASLMPICLAAKQLGITIHTAIFSWDNLPKARLCVEADYYLVWGAWMQQEMADYYPEIPTENVKLVGTPQFEFYLDDSKQSTREQFAKQNGLDVNKKWICFSGDDVKTSPYDAVFLEDVAEALAPYQNQLQLIFRRCPVDFSDRYDVTLDKYSTLITSIDPLWNTPNDTGWTGYFAKYEDINMQVNLAKHCETVINLGSTMAHDFTMFNKPCLYLYYNPVQDHDWNVDTIYQYQHFRSMSSLDAVGWLKSKASLAEDILKTINQQEVVAPDRKKWMENVVLQPVTVTSKLISKLF
ncbi:hypothetical protein ITJ86_13850 [Winogradskyella sp. F6397]|uniref:UDP-glycosyltransferase n=1 Tax=Winogradskyella marina TaxID=2785530 RepID=A0ABS0ENF2_9FLAO|nr:hypothetical protein [Winogradskyella marina]MBF8150990.1 hypothetical protein [Winogradskyella marina]